MEGKDEVDGDAHRHQVQTGLDSIEGSTAWAAQAANIYGQIVLEEYEELAMKQGSLLTSPCTYDTSSKEMKLKIKQFKEEQLALSQPNVKVGIFMAGGSGSGKSSVTRSLSLANGAIVLDIDKILMTLFPQDNAEKVYDCMKEMIPIMVDLTKRALDKGARIVKDGTGANPKRVLALAEEMKKGGYTVKMVAVYCPVEQALTRVATRARLENRNVPTEAVRRLHRGFAASLPIYCTSEFFDAVDVYNNADGQQPQLIFSGVPDLRQCNTIVLQEEHLQSLADLCDRDFS